MTRPFRWNIAKREQLGQLVSLYSEHVAVEQSFLDELRDVSARCLAYSGGADLVFVGRSPENFYDYLSGVFSETAGLPELTLLQFSMRWPGPSGVQSISPAKLSGLLAYFETQGLHPQKIAQCKKPIAFVDFIQYGGTMFSLFSLLKYFSESCGVDWQAVQRRLLIIGFTARTKNSPNTWRWQQNQDWLGLIPDTKIMNVSASFSLCCRMMGPGIKVTPSFHMDRWAEGVFKMDKQRLEHRAALAMACELYDLGAEKEERQKLAGAITKHPQMRVPSVRQLVSRLKSS